MDAAGEILIYVTVPEGDVGERIARALVEERLAACCNLLPGLRSIYRWEGKVEEGNEVLMLVKTTAERFEDLRDRLRSLHTYDLPEIIAVPIVAGLPEYLAWIRESVA